MENKEELTNKIKQLLSSQSLAVLATEKNGNPYINLIVFISDKDLRWLVFATNRSTRKFENIEANQRVALLIDNRCTYDFDTDKTVVASIIGKAEEVGDYEEIQLQEQYVAQHPHLKEFVMAPDCAFIKVMVEKYIVVQKFQEVSELDIKQ